MKTKIFIGPSRSGKSRKANEIASNYSQDEKLKIDSTHSHFKRQFGENLIRETTKIVIIEEFIGHTDSLFRIFSKYVSKVELLIICCDELITKDDLPKMASFTRRFEVIEFPIDNQK